MIKIQLDGVEEMERQVREELGEFQADTPKVLAKAINETAKQARTKVGLKAQETYTLKKGKFSSAFKLTGATQSKLHATLYSRGPAHPLSYFKVSPSKAVNGAERPEFYRAKVLKKNKYQRLVQSGGFSGRDLKAFLVKFKSGHLAVVERNPKCWAKADGAPRPKKRGTGVTKGRHALRQLYAPSLPRMLGSEQYVLDIVQPEIAQDMQSNIQKQIQKCLKANLSKAGG